MRAAAIKDAFSAADLFMQSEEQRLAYINREMAIMDYQSDMNASREEGREEGRKEGHEEGRKEGANEASISIAKNMMSMGISPDIIYQATGVNLQAADDRSC